MLGKCGVVAMFSPSFTLQAEFILREALSVKSSSIGSDVNNNNNNYNNNVKKKKNRTGEELLVCRCKILIIFQQRREYPEEEKWLKLIVNAWAIGTQRHKHTRSQFNKASRRHKHIRVSVSALPDYTDSFRGLLIPLPLTRLMEMDLQSTWAAVRLGTARQSNCTFLYLMRTAPGRYCAYTWGLTGHLHVLISSSI